MTLLCKGKRVSFEMKNGTKVTPPPGAAMLHDPAGTHWAKCSLLIAAYTDEGLLDDDAHVPGYARAYMGRKYRMRGGHIDTPNKSLDGWQSLGEIHRIYYTRGGTRMPFRFQHPFGKKTFFSVFRGKDTATLYKQGRFYRVQLGRSCLLDDRGIVHP